jgi:hypothetical protein
MARTLTTANSVFYITIPGVFSSPQKVQGYSTDAAWDTDSIQPTEVMIGVDGKKSSGFTPRLKAQTITLQADSQSNDLFDKWYEAMRSVYDDYTADAVIEVPGLGFSYHMTNGSLTGYKPLAGAGKVLTARPFIITWEDITRSAI